MKEAIHPDYKASKVVCACGNVIETRSTRGDFHIEICAMCHPFFTGKQKIMDTAGRIEKFKTRYAATPGVGAPPAPKAEPKKAAPAAPKKPEENRAAKRAKSGKSKKAEAPAAAPPAAAPAGEPAPE